MSATAVSSDFSGIIHPTSIMIDYLVKNFVVEGIAQGIEFSSSRKRLDIII
jgi:hypothetical protein